MGKFVYFTSTEKRQANEVDLPSFLRDRGEKLLKAGREYRLASDHSITVRANRWYDHAARRGGHAISFVRQFYDKTFRKPCPYCWVETDRASFPLQSRNRSRRSQNPLPCRSLT